MPPTPGGEPTPLSRAANIGRYIVLSLVGKGGMGEVYAAYDPELDRKVAIKLLRVRGNQAEAVEGRSRLLREAQAVAKLSHPNVVVVYDVGAFEDQVFMAMEFIDGHTLTYWMHAAARRWTEVLKVFAEAGRGLAAAHEKDMVHRDFKPDNVMLGTDGQVRVMDFGLARLMIGREAPVAPPPAVPTTRKRFAPPEGRPLVDDDDADLDKTRTIGRSESPPAPERIHAVPGDSPPHPLTETGAVLGTPAYMSPEQFAGRQNDARSDQFSFCIALYEALYGERPFGGTSLPALTASVLGGGFGGPPPDRMCRGGCATSCCAASASSPTRGGRPCARCWRSWRRTATSLAGATSTPARAPSWPACGPPPCAASPF